MGGSLSREQIKILNNADVEWEVVRWKRHPIVQLRSGDRCKRFAVSATSGDKRALANFKSDIRKFIKT